jgi:hypothetical protein
MTCGCAETRTGSGHWKWDSRHGPVVLGPTADQSHGIFDARLAENGSEGPPVDIVLGHARRTSDRRLPCPPSSSRRSSLGGQTFRSSRSNARGRTTPSFVLATTWPYGSPRIGSAAGQVEKEHRWLPRLAPHLPLAIPVPLAKGVPAEGYPWPWSVYRWLEGENASIDRIADLRQAATDLAHFVAALQRIDPAGGPPPANNSSRGVPLAMRDDRTRDAIASLHDTLDTDAVTAAWEAALQVPAWPGGLARWRSQRWESAGPTWSAQPRHRLWVSRRGRSRLRLDGCVDAPHRRNTGCVPRSAAGRRRDLGARSRLGTVRHADHPRVLPEHQPSALRHRPIRDW